MADNRPDFNLQCIIDYKVALTECGSLIMHLSLPLIHPHVDPALATLNVFEVHRSPPLSSNFVEACVFPN